MPDDNNFDITNVAVDEKPKDDFDVKEALSGRDRKITALAEENNSLKASLASTKSELESTFTGKLNDLEQLVKSQAEENARLVRMQEQKSLELGAEDLKDGELTLSGAEKVAKKEASALVQPLLDKIDSLESNNDQSGLIKELTDKIESMGRQTTRTSLNIDSRIADKAFIEWAGQTDYDMGGTKVLDILAEAEKANNVNVMRSIFSKYDSINREGAERPVSPTTGTAKPDLTPEGKKIQSKVESLQAERRKLSRNMGQDGVNKRLMEITTEISQLLDRQEGRAA